MLVEQRDRQRVCKQCSWWHAGCWWRCTGFGAALTGIPDYLEDKGTLGGVMMQMDQWSYGLKESSSGSAYLDGETAHELRGGDVSKARASCPFRRSLPVVVEICRGNGVCACETAQPRLHIAHVCMSLILNGERPMQTCTDEFGLFCRGLAACTGKGMCQCSTRVLPFPHPCAMQAQESKA